MSVMVVQNNQNYFSKKYAEQLAGSLSPNTRRGYLRDIMDFFGVNSLTEITIDAIRNVDVSTANRYREYLRSKGYALNTINRKLTSLSKFYSFLCRFEVGIMEYNPFSSKEGAARVRTNKQFSTTRCLTVEEVGKVINVAMQDNTLTGVRNQIIVLALATLGLRRAELAKIKIGDFDTTRGQSIVNIIGKGDKSRIAVVPDGLMRLIEKYLSMRGLTMEDKDEWLLVSHSTNRLSTKTGHMSEYGIYLAVKSLTRKAGFDGHEISPHSFRHTFITEALDSGCDLADVQDLAGHADISTTRRYDHTNRILKRSPAQMLENRFLAKGGLL